MAAQLKAEADDSFRKGKYVMAASKYSEAIAEDNSNAVLFANRAACYNALQKYGDAQSDARKATELNPGYAKAWSRLATAQDALGLLPESIESYQQAVAILSKPRLRVSASECQQKAVYEEALNVAIGKVLGFETISLEILAAMARAHDIPVPKAQTPEEVKLARNTLLRHPKFTTDPLLRLLLIPQSEDEPLRQVELVRGPTLNSDICRLLQCDLRDSAVLYSEDLIAYKKGKPYGVGVGRMHTSYEAFMDDLAVFRRPLNRRASALLHRPETHGPILVMKTTFIKSHPDAVGRSEDILCWDRLTEDDLRSPSFKALREEWIRTIGPGDLPHVLTIWPAHRPRP